MTTMRHLLVFICLAIPVIAGPANAQQEVREPFNERLAERTANAAMTILRLRPLTPLGLETAAGIMQQASELAPGDADLWRLTLNVADLAEDTELQREAVRALLRLDPDDTVIRLRRLAKAVEQAQTVEQRTAVYERLLAPKRIDELGDDVASRLAYDYALLLRREGRVSAFSEQLARAVELDPSNRAAAALATGFFRSNVDDPYGECELLINLFLADPTTLDVHAAIAQLALGSGAYTAADRMYTLLTNAYAARQTLPPTNIVADHAIAKWGAGRTDQGLELIVRRQQTMNALAQVQVMRQDQNRMPTDVAGVTSELTPTLSAVRAAVMERTRDPYAEQALGIAVRAYQSQIERVRGMEQQPAPRVFAEAFLDIAWIVLWLNGNADQAAEYIEQAHSIEPISETARARFDGWIALRRDELNRAADRFMAADQSDPTVRIGIALLHLKRQEKSEAAKLLLGVAREQPGTLIGVWSAHTLFNVVGQRAELSDTARQINALVSSLPTYIDRFPLRPAELFSVRVNADRSTFGPNEPIIINIEMSNNATVPLGIDASGPIMPQIALIPTMRVAQPTKLPPLEPIVVDIDRRLRLLPKQRITIRVDLRRYAIGTLMENFMLLGAFIRVKAIWNFRIAQSGQLEPDLLGGETETLNFRVDGMRITRAWLEQAIEDIRVIDRPDDVDTLIMLTHVPNYQLPDVPVEVLRPIVEKMPAALGEAFISLDPLQQALVLAEMSLTPVTHQIIESARASNEPLVQVSYLLNAMRNSQDPIMDVARRSDNELVRTVAEQLQAVAEMRQQMEQFQRMRQNSGQPGPAGQ